MKPYEAPSITKVGTVADLTQGNLLQRGHDSIQWVTYGGPFTGNGGGSSNGGGNGGGGFGS